MARPRTDGRRRALAKFTVGDECWLWTAGVNVYGYGTFWVDGGPIHAHRFVYEMFVGPIPDGLQLDHLCHDPAACMGGAACPHRRCVRPDHLEPVTPKVNSQRAGNAGRRKTHCPQGHPYDEANTRWYGTQRRCRACGRADTLARYHRLKESA